MPLAILLLLCHQGKAVLLQHVKEVHKAVVIVLVLYEIYLHFANLRGIVLI